MGGSVTLRVSGGRLEKEGPNAESLGHRSSWKLIKGIMVAGCVMRLSFSSARQIKVRPEDQLALVAQGN